MRPRPLSRSAGLFVAALFGACGEPAVQGGAQVGSAPVRDDPLPRQPATCSAGLRVGVLPPHRGYVRVGIRRTRAHDPDGERRAFAARLTPSGLPLEPEPSASAANADLGLLGQDMALLIAARAGRFVARLSGRALNPGLLEAAVQRVGSR